jgi:hypothetical protein
VHRPGQGGTNASLADSKVVLVVLPGNRCEYVQQHFVNRLETRLCKEKALRTRRGLGFRVLGDAYRFTGMSDPARCLIFEPDTHPRARREEKRMTRFTIRLLALALAAIPVASSADAATNGKTHLEKHAKKPQQAPIVNNARSSNPRYPSTYEDPDRKAGGY